MKRAVSKWALRAVPRDWRDSVERDLCEELPDGSAGLWFALHVLRIAVRLRVAHTIDGFRPERELRPAPPRSAPMRDVGRDL